MEQRVPAVQRGRMRERWCVPMGEVLVDARLRQRRRRAGFLKNPVLIFPAFFALPTVSAPLGYTRQFSRRS